MRKSIFKRFLALFLALCLLCGAGFAEEVKADKGTIKQVQEALNAAGFDCGTADGVSGKKTRAAIQAYQEANGLTANGEITEELLTSMNIPLPEAGSAETELKEVKGNTPIRSARIPIGGPAYVSNFDRDALMRENYMHENYLRWNLRVRVVGTVVDLRGLYPVEQQKTDRAILLQAADGSLFLADYTNSFITVPNFHLGDQLTASGRVGNTRIGVIQHYTSEHTRFYWDGNTLENFQQDVRDGYYEGMDVEATGDEALAIQADAIELGDRPAPVLMFESIASAPGHQLATMVDDIVAGLDVDVESGWLFFGSYELGKGYGGHTYLINYYTGAIFPYERWAEVYFCDDGILQFEWRDAETGTVVDPFIVFHYGYDYPEGEVEYDVEKYGEPRTYQLYSKFYNFDGSLRDEKYMGDFRGDQTTLEAFRKFDMPEDELCRKYKAHMNAFKRNLQETMLDNRELLEFVDEDGDAVAYDSDGNELIRYPGTDASKLQGLLMKKQGIITVSYRNLSGEHTEIFIPGESDEASGEESATADETVLIEKNAPLPSRSAPVEDSGNSKYTSNVDYYGIMAGYPADVNIRIVGAVSDLGGKWPLETQEQINEIVLETENGETYFVEYGYEYLETGGEVSDYQIGDILTVCGSAVPYPNTWHGVTGMEVYPDFIAAGDVPAPDA